MNDNDLALALERLVAERKRIGPSPALQQAVWAIAATTPPERRWLPRIDRWGSTMFSALKFIAAGVIVALFGGFLLAAILTTQQGDEMAPGAVTASPSPMTTEALLSGMVTEEVEPGVYRVLDDGVRELARSVREDVDLDVERGNIVAGLDGSVWLFLPDRFFRLGAADQEARGWRWYDQEADIEVGPDGRVWLIAEREDGRNDLVWFRDRLDPEDALSKWSDPAPPDRANREYVSVEIDEDGTVYRAWFHGPASDPGRRDATVEALQDEAITASVIELPRHVERWDLAAGGPDEYVWLAVAGTARLGSGSGSLMEPPIDPWQLDVGQDDAIWIQAIDLDAPEPEPEGAVLDSCGLRLARYDGSVWTTWGRDDGVPDVGSVFWLMGCWPGIHAAGPDGSIWLASRDYLPGRDCTGIANFDGVTWSRYLDGLCVYDADIAPDGAVWLQAGELLRAERGTHGDGVDRAFGPVDIYVITPEVVAGTE